MRGLASSVRVFLSGWILPAALAILAAGCSPKAGSGATSPDSASGVAKNFVPPPPAPPSAPVKLPTPPEAPTTSYSLKELVPFSLHLDGPLSGPLPRGALLDPPTNTLYWLPQKGQSGTYTFRAGPMNISLQVGQAQNLNQGPPRVFQDGSVGFVYVHGLSEENYCLDPYGLAAYWGATPDVLSPQPGTRKLACYDGTRPVEESALFVAQQILSAPCGTYNKCIVVAHSMGNLVMEYILTHARPATAADPEPALFANSALFEQVKNKVIFVISLASAAGGSKAATILNDPSQANLVQQFVREFTAIFGGNTPATKSLVVQRAANVLAPVQADPGVPFFMVGGFTTQTVTEYGGVNAIFGKLPLSIYDGDTRYAGLDPVVRFSSRSDGMVDFRSACGIASANDNSGPGYTAPLADHFQYCLSAARKPNHFLWFLTNLNHSLIALPWQGCANQASACYSFMPDSTGSFMNFDATSYGKSSIEVIRSRLQ